MLIEKIDELGIRPDLVAWLRKYLTRHQISIDEADRACALTYNFSDLGDELLRSEMYLILCARGYPSKWDDARNCGAPHFHLLKLDEALPWEQEKARALATDLGLLHLLSKWGINIPVSTQMPEDGLLCNVIFANGTVGQGYWLGNDPVAPLPAWNINITEQWCAGKTGEQQNANGPVSSWQYAAAQ